MVNVKEFVVENIPDKSVIIYGATVGGKVVFQCLRKHGIKVDFFCDQKKSGECYCGVPVKHPDILKMENGNRKILIALTRSFNSACQFLQEINYKEVYSCGLLISGKKIDDFEYDENEKVAILDFLNKYPIYAGDKFAGKIYFPSLEVFITERCTLRCRDCSHLIPRYVKPVDYDIDEIINDLDNVLKVVEYIIDLIILGGEPILHKELYKLLEYGFSHTRIGTMTILTNGTVLPDEKMFTIMKKTGARLRISNYGEFSRNKDAIKQKCNQEGIECFINEEPWVDMGKIYNHNYSEQELRELFADCPFAFSWLLLKGSLYQCAHVAHLNNLGVLDSKQFDSFNFRNNGPINIEEERKNLREYMNIEFLRGCNYCNGIKNGILGIEPAIQGVR